MNVPTDGSSITINGLYGELTIDSDGEYSYTRNPGSEGGDSDVFTYTLTDGDGDQDTATLTVSITDLVPAVSVPAVGDAEATVYESDLAGGTDAASGAESVSGSFTFTPGDGLPSVSLHGVTIVTDGVAVTMPIDITTPLGHTLTVTAYTFDAGTNTGTVSYTYTLSDQETHAAPGNDPLTESFAVVVTDQDGDPAPAANLVLTIVDDIPVITQPAVALPDLEVSEEGTNLGVPANADFSTAFDYEAGADGEQSHAYALSVDNPSSGLTDAATGQAIVLVKNADGSITGHVGDATGALAFTIIIDAASGVVTLEQDRALVHGEPGDATETVLSIAGNAIGLSLSVTDLDGDTTTSTVSNIGGHFTFVDDVPTIATLPGSLDSAQLDETGLAAGAPVSVTVDDFATGVFNPDYGHDGAADDDSLVYSLAVSAGGADSGLVDTESGESILLRMNGDTVEGYTETGGDLVFSVAVDSATGALTLTQHRAIEHSDPADANEPASPLANNLIQLVGTVTDGDGDTESRSVDIGGKISFLDDVPMVGTPESAQVGEANLPLGIDPDPAALTVIGSLDVTVSADGIDTQFSPDTSALLALDLTSGGTALTYAVSPDGHTLTATAGGATIFTATITNPGQASAGYQFVLSGPLDHDGAESLDIELGIVVTDDDGDTATGSFTVTVNDDPPVTDRVLTVDEDNSNTFNTTSDASPDNTVIEQDGDPLPGVDNAAGGKDYKTENGTVTVNANGTVTYAPDAHYSGTEVFDYVTTDGGQTNETTVTMTVNPVSDQPTLSVDAADINTLEDTAVALGLQAPVIADNGTGTGNNPTSELLGLITLDGFPDGVILQDGSGGALHTFAGGPITILLSDGPSATGLTGATLTMTRAEFEALKVLPPQNTHQNFTVEMTAVSHEVDAAGNIVNVGGAPVAGAESSISVEVHVQAVTDDAELTFDTSVATGTNGATVVYDSATKATVTLDEDTAFTLNDMLISQFGDLDGSEVRSITITNNTDQPIDVNGAEIAVGASTTVDAIGQTGGIDSFPTISIAGGQHVSGDLNGITITLNAQDGDADGYWNGAEVGAGPGVSEADTSNNSVTLDLRVKPIAGDVVLEEVETTEDTAVAFLSGMSLVDSGTGTEVVDSVSFEVPAGWTLTPPAAGAGWSATGDGTPGSTYTITFDGTLNQADRQGVLDSFMITPPAHSSLDATIALTVSTTDSNTVGGVPLSDTNTQTVDAVIKVSPVAEIIAGSGNPDSDTDGDLNPDLTMTPGRAYGKEGEEDQWFDLSKDALYDALPAFALANGWANQDTSSGAAGGEATFARLTPVLTVGDGSITNANGVQFKWVEDGVTKTATYTGVPIDVPMASLGTLQFLAPPDFSGLFEIEVRAVTIDYDEDDGTPSVEAVSDPALLTNVLILPAADEVTLAVNGRIVGAEDTAIPLTIKPTSSDPSEVFTVTISGIPVGAIITYDGQTVLLTSGPDGLHVVIKNFDRNVPLSILPPPNSNEDFTLKVDATSTDTLTVGTETYNSQAVAEQLTIEVDVKGVADEVDVTTLTAPSRTEAGLDGGTETMSLKDLVEFAKTDAIDGSETLSVRVSGLPEGFSPSAGTLLSAGAAGEARVWILTEAQYAAATINVPVNYSGTVTFQVTPVTTEDDGNSLTGDPTDISFTVTPSPEAAVTTSATLVEDEVTSLGFGIVHQNGDIDETLVQVRIERADAAGPNFTLYLGTGVGAISLAEALTAGTISVDPTDPNYYLLSAEQAATLSAKGGAHLDGALTGFDFQYQIIDSQYGTEPSGPSTTSPWQDGHFTLDASPVTDQPVLSITDIDGVLGSTVATDVNGGDDAVPDTATLSVADTVTVTLNVASPDSDGSEHVIRVIIDGVPEDVSVVGAEFIGDGRWLLIYENTDALPINAGGGIALPVQFVVSPQAGGIDQDITLTVQVQDRGNSPGQDTDVLSDSVTWHLTTNFTDAPGEIPATIVTWEYNGAPAAEDTSFSLSEIITGSVQVFSTQPNTFTIRLEDLPEGTLVNGMTRTTVDEGGQSKVVWTASVTSTLGMTLADIQDLLDGLMAGITLTPPADANTNGAAPFSITASLTTSVLGGDTNDVETISPTVPVEPRTDAATIDIAQDTAVDADLVESDTGIPITLTVANSVDGAFGSIVDGQLYLQLTADAGLEGGTLTVDGVVYTMQTVSGVSGIADGQYYVISGVSMGDTLQLLYTPPAMTAGDITVQGWVRNVEANDDSAGAVVVATGTGSVTVQLSNDGVDIVSAPISGAEAPDTETGSLIQLTGLGITLNDGDGSESIISILLSNLPDGFLVYTGTNAGDAAMSNNAGGSAGFNTWVIPLVNGALPPYIAILPPAHWSGTLSGLTLQVESGEASLPDTVIDQHTVAPIVIDPVANGIVIAPTLSFGPENSVISLNLNSAMQDAADASVKDGATTIAPDGSVETTTLKITGLGEYASFYLGNVLIHDQAGIQVTSSGAGADTVYTITGLSQADLDTLGFMQAGSALVDQDGADAGVQVDVEAWTVESGLPGEPSASTIGQITLSVSAQFGTTSNDTLIWTGNTINASNGSDIVQMRSGEDLTGEQLAAQLSGVETIDMSIGGANEITGLTPDQLKAIVGAAGNSLEVSGTADDLLSLSGDWQDNGDGTYTGTLSGSGTVTLTVSGAVEVDTSAVAAPFAPFAFLADEGAARFAAAPTVAHDADGAAQSDPGLQGSADAFPAAFGLANLALDDADPDEAFLFGLEGGQPSLAMVLQPFAVTAVPVEPGLAQGAAEAEGEADHAFAGVTLDEPSTEPYLAYEPGPAPLNDELQHDLQSGMALA